MADTTYNDFATTDVLAQNCGGGLVVSLLARLDPMHMVGAFAALDVLWQAGTEPVLFAQQRETGPESSFQVSSSTAGLVAPDFKSLMRSLRISASARSPRAAAASRSLRSLVSMSSLVMSSSLFGLARDATLAAL